MQYADVETGGDLFGYWTHSGSPIVSYVIGPGHRCRRSVTSFYQDERYLHDVGTELYDAHALQHIGEWHSHHRLGLNEPSGGDVATVGRGLREKQWPRFLLLIASIADYEAGHTLHNYFLFGADTDAPQPVRVLLLPGTSPFRLGDDPREEEMRWSGVAKWKPGPFTPRSPVTEQEPIAEAWFDGPQGKAILNHATAKLRDAGIPFRILRSKDGRALNLVLPAATLFLGDQFPANAPTWIGSERQHPHEPWTSSADLIDWYIQSTARERCAHSPSSTGSSTHGVVNASGEGAEAAQGTLPSIHDSGS